MSLMEFRCPKCKAATDVFVMSMEDEKKNPTMCISQDPVSGKMCWTPMKRYYTVPAIRGDTVSKP